MTHSTSTQHLCSTLARPVPSETRLGKPLYDPGHCIVTHFQAVTELLIAKAIFVESHNSNSQILREFFAMRCHVEHLVASMRELYSKNQALTSPKQDLTLKQHRIVWSCQAGKTWTWWIVILNQLSSFLSKHNLLDANQSGFRCRHSSETALLSVTEALRIAKADSKSSVLILLDLSAFFYTFNHHILLSTISSLGITGIPLHWFESYLNDRYFKVAWGGEVSPEHQLVTGVPQGSVLGPLLFSTYITSLGLIRQTHCFSYHC